MRRSFLQRNAIPKGRFRGLFHICYPPIAEVHPLRQGELAVKHKEDTACNLQK